MRKTIKSRVLAFVCAVALTIPSTIMPTPAQAAVGGTETVKKGDNTTAMSKNGYSFDHSYVKPGDTLKVLYTEGETTTEVTEDVAWTVKQVVSGTDTKEGDTITGESVTYKTIASETAPVLTIKEEYLESVIYAQIGETKLTIYCSKTPVIYINSETEYYDITKEYTDEDTTTINLVGNDKYADKDYWYNGTGEIKIRGNSTASRPKRPFKLKLSDKADLLGLGTETKEDGTKESYKSKHWVLLANDIDHSLLRNKLLYDFSGDIGTEVYFNSTNVTLIYNGQYEGVYQLCEHRRVDEGRIDITDWTGLGEDAADTIGKAVAEEKGWEKATRKEFIRDLEEAFATDYSWIDDKKITVSSALLGEETTETKSLGDLTCGGFATTKTDWITLNGNFDLTFNFHIQAYQDAQELEKHDNFCVEFVSSGEKNYLTTVCNGNIWWANDNTGGWSRDGIWEGDLSNECSDTDMSLMDDADVVLNIKRNGDDITMSADITGSDNATGTFEAKATNTAGFPETLKLHLMGEQCKITGIRYVENKLQSATYHFADYDITLPDTTGGYLAEMDFYSIGDTTVPSMTTSYQQPLYVSAPEPGEDADGNSAKTAIVNSFKETSLYAFANRYTQTFEYALHSDDFHFRNDDTKYKAVLNGWGNTNATYQTTTYTDDENNGKHYAELFDMDSLVNNFLFCEYAMNWDSMKNSFFYYKDHNELGVIAPQWDFDWCWGNTNMYNINTNYPTSWHTTEEAFTVEQYYQTVQWNRMLVRDPYFLTLVYEKYNQIRPIIENMVKEGGLIDQYFEYLKEAGATNDKRWSYTYSRDYSGATSQGFADSVSWIKSFLNKRVAWLDKQFASVDTLANSLGYYKSSSDITVEGTVAADKVTFRATVTNANVKKVRFQIDGTTTVEAAVTDGKASADVAKADLKADGLHTVVVNAVDADGKYIYNVTASKTGIYNVVKSTYAVFDLAKEETFKNEELSTNNDNTNNDTNDKNDTNKNDTNKNDTNKNDTNKNDTDKTPDKTENGANDTKKEVPKIKLNVSSLKMKKGTSCTGIVARDLMDGDKVVSYKSSKSKVVSVTKKGKLKAKKLGKATITVTTKLGASAKIKITVIKGKVKTKKITLTAKKVKLKKGKSYTIKPILNPISSTDKVKYSSSKKKVATVSAKGKVKAKAKGKTVITVKSGKKKVKLTITVK